MTSQSKTRTLIVGETRTTRSVYKDIGKDVYFYVSGSKNTKDNGLTQGSMDDDRRVAVFGGDVVISGSLKVEGGELAGSFDFDCDSLELTGSLDVEGTGSFTAGVAVTNITTLAGDPFFIAGSGISFSTALSGQTTISSTSTSIEWNERLSGTADGSNDTFTLAYTPSSSTSLMVFVNGILQESGVQEDYTISGSTITFNSAPRPDSKITATYSR